MIKNSAQVIHKVCTMDWENFEISLYKGAKGEAA
jgi:hypothetical protein